MDAETGIRDKVLKYLAKAGVLGDEIRRDPAGAAEALLNVAEERDFRKMVDEEGFSPQEAMQWLHVRDRQKRDRKIVTAIWYQHGAKQHEFAILTNKVHNVATGRTASEHKRQLAVKDSPRNYISAAQNAAIQITEFTAGLRHEHKNSFGYDELAEDIESIRPIIDAARPEIHRVFSDKPRRLPGENRKPLSP